MKINRVNFTIFCILLAIYPYIFLADAIYEINILGSSVYFIIELFFAYYLFLSNLIKTNNKYLRNITLLILFLYVFFLSVNLIIYENNINFIKDYRIGISITVYMFLAKTSITNNKDKYFLGKIIIINAIALSVFALLHHFYFDHIIVCRASNIPGQVFIDDYSGKLKGMRECSFVFQPTVFSNLVLMGMFVNIFLLGSVYKKTKWKKLALTILFLFAIFLSISRLPMFFAILLTLAHLYKMLKFKGVFWTLVLFLLLISIINSDFIVIERLSTLELRGDRYERYMVGLQTVFYNVTNVLIGTDRLLMAELRTSSGIKFTDNSFIYIMLFFGVIYLFLIILYIIAFLLDGVNLIKNRYQLLLSIFIFFGLLFTSYVFQDILLLYSFTTLILLSERYNDRDSESNGTTHACSS